MDFEKQKILDMIEKGKITAAEGMELLNALNGASKSEVMPPNKEKQAKKEFKFLRIRVETESETKVNVNVPLKLIKAVGGLVPQVSGFIPNEAKEKMDQKGINLGSLDLDAILEALESGGLEDTTLVDITANDDEDGQVRVRIYVE